MHRQEAKWIKEALDGLSVEDISPLLNIGSSSGYYREKQQPFISELIFDPLIKRGVEVIHQDIKDEAGVDVVGDLTKKDFINKLKEKQYKCVVCSNLLEHVSNRKIIVDALKEIVREKGVLIITVPCKYPKHMDPIDTMYRPSTKDLADEFAGYEVFKESEISVGSPLRSYKKDIIGLLKLHIRIFLPFYKYKGWITSVNKYLWLFKNRSVSCVALRK